MVSPVTGPFITVNGGSGWYERKSSYRQRRPYNLNLPFVYEVASCQGTNSSQTQRWLTFAGSINTDRAYAKAYSKIVDQLGDPASMGVTLAQWKEADGMIRNRASQLTGFTKAIIRRSPAGVAASLGLSLKECQRIMRKRYGVAQSLSNLWLEFWFGWKPAISDIYTACEVFDQDIPWGRMRGRSTHKIPDRIVQAAPEPLYPGWDGFEGIRYSSESKVSLGIDVRIANPNVHLLNQFGLLNPLTVAWDVIPWSFVLGWVSNVSSWLSSFTDFAGLETSNGYIKTTRVAAGSTWWTGPFQHEVGSGIARSVNRGSLSTLPRPKLMWKELKVPPTRGLTAISLLTQQLARVTSAPGYPGRR